MMMMMMMMMIIQIKKSTTYTFFYIHGSVHRHSILILVRSNKIQQYACVYLLQNYSTCFGCLSQRGL